MSICTDKLFVITKGVDNTFVFTIKANSSTLPISITGTDTFTAALKTLSDSSVVLSKPLTVVDALSGEVQLVITQAEADTLEGLKGEAVDRYYLKPVYSLLIESSTVSEGDFLATVCEVYVD